MQLKGPTKTTWIIALVLGVISLVASLFTIPVLTDLAPWIALVGLALMLLAAYIKGL